MRDLDRAAAFYAGLLNRRETERVADHHAFLTGGALRHEIALQRVATDVSTPLADGTGPYHVTFDVPVRREFAEGFAALTAAEIPIGTVDQYISWALYFNVPDGTALKIDVDMRSKPEGRPLWHRDIRSLPPETMLRTLAE
jgi:catechol-2,3-dioxygenase